MHVERVAELRVLALGLLRQNMSAPSRHRESGCAGR